MIVWSHHTSTDDRVSDPNQGRARKRVEAFDFNDLARSYPMTKMRTQKELLDYLCKLSESYYKIISPGIFNPILSIV